MEMKIGKEQSLVEFANSYMDHYITWDTVTWLKSITNLPVVIKGILTGHCCYVCVLCRVETYR